MQTREKKAFIHRSGRGGDRESIHSQAQVEDETEGNTYQGEESIHPQAQVEEKTEKDTD
jgi:hypothetical protein